MRDAISEEDERAFQQGLIEIADLNPLGRPNLELRWAAVYLDPQMPDGKPKYYLSTPDPVLVGHQYRDTNGDLCVVKLLTDVPADKISLPIYSQEHLGERRFIVEIWRSPDFLRRSGRYAKTWNDEIRAWFACRNCGQRVPTTPGTEKLDIKRTCPACGSSQVSPVEERTDHGHILNPVSEHGCYDFFYRIQRQDGTYHPPDQRALSVIRQRWAEHIQPFAVKDAQLRAARTKQAAEAAKRKSALWQGVEKRGQHAG